jgi:hypothetical protein
MDSPINRFVEMIDQIDWSSISSLRQIHTVLSMKIDQLTPDIPSDQDRCPC